MEVTDVAEDNVYLRARAAQFATSRVVELIGRPHLDVFQQNRLISPNADVHLKLIPSAYNFVCKSVAPQNAQQQNYNHDLVRLADHSHKTAHQRRRESAQIASRKSGYASVVHSRSGETFIYSPKPNQLEFRQRVSGFAAGPGGYWTPGRRRLCRRLPAQSVQFQELRRQPYRAASQ